MSFDFEALQRKNGETIFPKSDKRVKIISREDAQEHKDVEYHKDRLRQFHDIRNMKEEDLTTYQKIQLREVKKQLYQLEMRDLRKAIFRTFEGPEEDGLINYPLEKELIEMEVRV